MLHLFRRIPLALSAITQAIVSLGNAWISRTSVTTANITDVAYGLDRFIAAGGNITSVNGIDWTTLNTAVDKKPVGSLIAFGNDRFVSANNDTANYSIDGINWIGASDYPNASVVNSIRFLNGKFYLCTTKLNTIYESEDGIVWTERIIITGQNITFNDIAFKDNVWLIVGSVGGFPPGRILRSINNMVSWTVVTAPYNYNAVGIAANKNTFFIIINSSNGEVYKSTDGITWQQPGTLKLGFPTYAISCCNDLIIIGGWATNIYVIKNNDVGVRYNPAAGNANVFYAAYGKGLIIIAGTGGHILTSV